MAVTAGETTKLPPQEITGCLPRRIAHSVPPSDHTRQTRGRTTQNSMCCSLSQTGSRHTKTEVKEMVKHVKTNCEPDRENLGMLISDKEEFKVGIMKMANKEYFRVIKGVINQINLYNPDNIASKYIKQKEV